MSSINTDSQLLTLVLGMLNATIAAIATTTADEDGTGTAAANGVRCC